MLSYQHIYHAGNLADVHKHSLLSWVLSYLTQKDKPLSYIETHAGRGLYNLKDPAAQKTGEAARGIMLADGWFAADHPYTNVLKGVRAKYGPDAYPGSPLVAAEILRPVDSIQLSEMHPQEFAALKTHIAPYGGVLHQKDGWETTMSLCPPVPRRGLLLIDPSFERKEDYRNIPGWITKLHRKWNVGVIMLWYPVLTEPRHRPMISALRKAIPDAKTHEVCFPPAREGHGMIGSGLFVVNAPWGFEDAARDIAALFQDYTSHPM